MLFAARRGMVSFFTMSTLSIGVRSAEARDAAVRANERWKRTLREYEEPPLDEGIHEALIDWLRRRKASFPDSDV